MSAMTGKNKYTEVAALDTLKAVFGFQAFRLYQERTIRFALKKDSLVQQIFSETNISRLVSPVLVSGGINEVSMIETVAVSRKTSCV